MKYFKADNRLILSKPKGEINIVLLILLSLISINCTRYATEKELNFIKNLEQEVYQFEIQNKALKEKTLELELKKHDHINKLKECRKKLDEFQTILPNTSKNENQNDEN